MSDTNKMITEPGRKIVCVKYENVKAKTSKTSDYVQIVEHYLPISIEKPLAQIVYA